MRAQTKQHKNNVLQFPTPGIADIQPETNEFRKHEPNYRGSDYLGPFVIPGGLRNEIDLCVRALRPHLDRFDAIAFTGMSGALIASPVAMALGKEIIMVRKLGQSSHSPHEVEGDFAARYYIILDDFRSSGATEDNIVTAIKRNIPDAEYVGFMGALDLTEFDVEYAETNGIPIELKSKKDMSW